MNDVHILKITVSLFSEGKTETSETTTQCVYFGTPDNYTIEFDEAFADDMNSRTTLNVRNSKCVRLLRKGSVDADMVMEEGIKHNCVYSTPYGDIIIGVRASEIESLACDNFVHLRLRYEIDYRGNATQEREIRLDLGKILEQSPER